MVVVVIVGSPTEKLDREKKNYPFKIIQFHLRNFIHNTPTVLETKVKVNNG